MSNTFTHDPQAVLDYMVDLTAWLDAGEMVSAATATPTGIVLVNGPAAVVNSGTAIRVWAGAPSVLVGQTATINVHFTTDQGRQDDATLRLIILEH